MKGWLRRRQRAPCKRVLGTAAAAADSRGGGGGDDGYEHAGGVSMMTAYGLMGTGMVRVDGTMTMDDGLRCCGRCLIVMLPCGMSACLAGVGVCMVGCMVCMGMVV